MNALPIYEWEEQSTGLSTYGSLTRDKWEQGQSATESTTTPSIPFSVLRRALREHFMSSLDVTAIFLMNEGTSFKAFVITDHASYSREKMYRLIDLERALVSKLRDRFSLDIDYLPQLGRPLKDIVPVSATAIFWR